MYEDWIFPAPFIEDVVFPSGCVLTFIKYQMSVIKNTHAQIFYFIQLVYMFVLWHIFFFFTLGLFSPLSHKVRRDSPPKDKGSLRQTCFLLKEDDWMGMTPNSRGSFLVSASRIWQFMLAFLSIFSLPHAFSVVLTWGKI